MFRSVISLYTFSMLYLSFCGFFRITVFNSLNCFRQYPRARYVLKNLVSALLRVSLQYLSSLFRMLLGPSALLLRRSLIISFTSNLVTCQSILVSSRQYYIPQMSCISAQTNSRKKCLAIALAFPYLVVQQVSNLSLMSRIYRSVNVLLLSFLTYQANFQTCLRSFIALAIATLYPQVLSFLICFFFLFIAQLYLTQLSSMPQSVHSLLAFLASLIAQVYASIQYPLANQDSLVRGMCSLTMSQIALVS